MRIELDNASAAAGQSATAVQPRLVKAAHEFEGLMMKELLKPMTEGDALTGEEDSDGGTGTGGALTEFASEVLGQALSQRGGFGIADEIVRDLSRSGNHSASGKVTPDLHRNTMMPGKKSLE